MKRKKIEKLGFVVSDGKKTPEELQRRLSQRANIVPSRKQIESKKRKFSKDHNLLDD
jgi:hypothetical protein